MNVELGEAPMEKNPAVSDGFSTASNVTGLSGSHNTGPYAVASVVGRAPPLGRALSP